MTITVKLCLRGSSMSQIAFSLFTETLNYGSDFNNGTSPPPPPLKLHQREFYRQTEIEIMNVSDFSDRKNMQHFYS